MRRHYRRLFVPIIIACAGLSLLLYGGLVHTVQITSEKDVAQTKRAENRDAPDQPGELHGSSVWGVSPSQDPSAQVGSLFVREPAFAAAGAKSVQQIVATEPERELVRELSVGGVTLRDGVLWRTYRGDPPLLCPT